MQPRLLLVLLLVALVSPWLQRVAADRDGCYECAVEGDCDEAYDGEDGKFCGQVSNRYYCCPRFDRCDQTRDDAICVSPTGRTRLAYTGYATSTSSGGAVLAGWIIAIIVLLPLCCCLAIAGALWRRRRMNALARREGLPGGAPYQRKFSHDAQAQQAFGASLPGHPVVVAHVQPPTQVAMPPPQYSNYGAFAAGQPSYAQNAAPAYGPATLPVGVPSGPMGMGAPQVYRDSGDSSRFQGAPRRMDLAAPEVHVVAPGTANSTAEGAGREGFPPASNPYPPATNPSAQYGHVQPPPSYA